MHSNEDSTSSIHRVWAVRVFVTNQEKAIAFFRDVLEIPMTLHAPNYGWVEMGPPDERAKIALVEPNADADAAVYEWQQAHVGVSTGIVFETKDIEGLYRRLKKRGVRFSMPLQKMPWGGIMAIFEDPDGNQYQLVEDPDHYTRDYT